MPAGCINKHIRCQHGGSSLLKQKRHDAKCRRSMAAATVAKPRTSSTFITSIGKIRTPGGSFSDTKEWICCPNAPAHHHTKAIQESQWLRPKRNIKARDTRNLYINTRETRHHSHIVVPWSSLVPHHQQRNNDRHQGLP